MEAIKPLQIDEGTHTNLKRLAKEHGRSMKQLIAEMVNYFKQSGQDPQEVNAGSSASAIKSLERRLTTFMRKQEKEALGPMLDELAVASMTLKKTAGSTISGEEFKQKIDQLINALKQVNQHQTNEIHSLKTAHNNQVKSLLNELQQIKSVIEEKMGKKGLFN